MPSDSDELERDHTVIAAATPGPWTVQYVDDDLFMNSITIATATGTGQLDDHLNNVAVVLLQEPRYADVSDGRRDENAEFIARARTRWPEVINSIAVLNERIDALCRENRDLRAKLTEREQK